ncbi:MAG: rhomboid family intramembrane serine protease [Nitrococcus mobilis]|nr:rhomboid family intramembrane serine protease [Nitrococcus mobilis]
MNRDRSFSSQTSLPPVVLVLLISNALVFLWQQMGGSLAPVFYFGLWPFGIPEIATAPIGVGQAPGFHVWQLVSYAFLHGSMLHLFANMFALWMFGVQIENLWGSRPFAFYYFFCIVGAGLIQLIVASIAAGQGDVYPTIGASGGVFGILLAFGMMFPNQMIFLLFPPIPMKAKYFVLLYGAFELWAGFTGSLSGVAHFAHIGGMIFGFVLIQYWRGRLPIKPKHRLHW